MNLVEMLEAANRPRPAMPLAPTRQAKPDERAWQLEWARRNREISARLKAAQAASNDARVLATMQRRSGVWTTRDLAHVLRVNADWLRKHPLRRLCEALPLLAALSPGFWMTAGPWKSIGSALTGRVTLAACCTGLHGGRPGRWDTSGSSHTPCQKKVGQVCELLAGNSLAGVVAEIGMYRAGLGLIPILYCAAKSCFGRHKNKWCIATWIFPFHTKIRIAVLGSITER